MMEIHDYEIKNMIRMANEARERAYVPYSKFHVGACLKAKNGAYYLGCNIERRVYPYQLRRAYSHVQGSIRRRA